VLVVLLDLLVTELTTDQTLEGEDSVLRVDDRLTLGRETDETLAMLGEGDDGGCGSGTLSVLDDSGSLPLHDGHTRVGGSEVNADNRA
jgi:hypothetical protein